MVRTSAILQEPHSGNRPEDLASINTEENNISRVRTTNPGLTQALSSLKNSAANALQSVQSSAHVHRSSQPGVDNSYASRRRSGLLQSLTSFRSAFSIPASGIARSPDEPVPLAPSTSRRDPYFTSIASLAPSLGITPSFAEELDLPSQSDDDRTEEEREKLMPIMSDGEDKGGTKGKNVADLAEEDQRKMGKARTAEFSNTRPSVRGIFTRFNTDLSPKDNNGALAKSSPTTAHSIAPDDSFSVPAFRFRPFMREGSRDTDLVSIYTNAVRYQTRGLYLILYCLKERIEAIQTGDLVSLFSWYHPYHDFFSAFITVVNDILMPSLRDLVPFRHRTPSYFATEGEHLNHIVAKTKSCENYFCQRLTLQESTNKLCKIYSSFAQPLLTYLFSLEEYSSVIVSSFCSDIDVNAMAVDMIRAFRSMPRFPRHLSMLLSWLQPRPQTTDRWLRMHCDVFSVVLYRWWKREGPQERTIQYFRLTAKSVLFY